MSTRMIRRLALVGVVALGSGLMSAAAVQHTAGSQGAVVYTAPLDFSEAQADIEACVGETLTVTGGQYRLVLTDDVFHANAFGGVAVGDRSGAIYRIAGHQQDVAFGSDSSAGGYSFVVTLDAIGRGGAGNFVAHFLFHGTYTPGGVLTADISKVDVTCV